MPDSAALQLTLRRERVMLSVKSWLPEHANGGRRARLAGAELPSQVGAVSLARARALCLAPNEWLIVSPDASVPGMAEQGLALVDVSDALAVLEIRGAAAREALSRGCGLDLHPEAFPAGRCARTRFAQIAIILECLGPQEAFELTAARSYLQYLRDWLTDAAVEFSMTP